jgi:hypothetical protein
MVRNASAIRPAGAAWVAGLVLAAFGGWGCHHTKPEIGVPVKPSPVLAITPRFPIDPDTTALPSETSGIPNSRPGKYRQLTAIECRCLAIRSAPFADDLDQHADNVGPKHPITQWCSPRKADSARVSRQVRGHAADELRNSAAGDALEQYYKLAQSEMQHDLLVEGHAELKAQLGQVEKAEQQGFKGSVTADEIRVQLLDLEAQLALLEAGIGQLNASVRARIGLEPSDPLPIWPDDPLRVRPDDVDPEQAVATGLHYRPDLNVLRVLVADDSIGAAEVRQQVLASVSPLLAAANKINLLGGLFEVFTHSKAESDAASRRSVASALQAREKQAEAEIRAAVLNLQGQKAAAVATASEVRRQTLRVQELEKRQKAGQQVAGELAKARLDRLKSRGNLLKIAADWNAAEVKLRQTMGLLVREGCSSPACESPATPLPPQTHPAPVRLP